MRSKRVYEERTAVRGDQGKGLEVTRTASDATVERPIERAADTVFGLPGGEIRHEEVGVTAAAGYAKSTGRLSGIHREAG